MAVLIGSASGLEVSPLGRPKVAAVAASSGLPAAASLLSRRALFARSSALQKRQAEPKPPSFFGDFDESESTDGTGLDTERVVVYGRDASRAASSPNRNGAAAAGASIVGAGHPRETSRDTRAVRGGGWFDASVRHYDALGRSAAPAPGSVRDLVEFKGWFQRSVNTTLTCKDPGCSAKVALQAFDGGAEEVGNCKLSLFLHPTDFDDDYSGERLDYIRVNGRLVNTDCYPRVNGCGAAAQASMFACVRDLPLDGLVGESGAVVVEAKISDVVDECPYEGNLLAAVPIVSCLVAPNTTTTTTTTASTTTRRPPPEPVVPTVYGLPGRRGSGANGGTGEDEVDEVARSSAPRSISLGATFRCMERGCRAEAELQLNQSVLEYRQCLLTVTVNQTDFDGDTGSAEQLEFVRLNGEDFVMNATPGYNPCRAACDGHPLTTQQKAYVALSDVDVTDNVTDGDGRLLVEVKISDFVDECSYEGYLLAGYALVNCTFEDPSFE